MCPTLSPFPPPQNFKNPNYFKIIAYGDKKGKGKEEIAIQPELHGSIGTHVSRGRTGYPIKYYSMKVKTSTYI